MIITYDGSYMHKPVRYIVDVDAEDDATGRRHLPFAQFRPREFGT